MWNEMNMTRNTLFSLTLLCASVMNNWSQQTSKPAAQGCFMKNETQHLLDLNCTKEHEEQNRSLSDDSCSDEFSGRSVIRYVRSIEAKCEAQSCIFSTDTTPLVNIHYLYDIFFKKCSWGKSCNITHEDIKTWDCPHNLHLVVQVIYDWQQKTEFNYVCNTNIETEERRIFLISSVNGTKTYNRKSCSCYVTAEGESLVGSYIDNTSIQNLTTSSFESSTVSYTVLNIQDNITLDIDFNENSAFFIGFYVHLYEQTDGHQPKLNVNCFLNMITNISHSTPAIPPRAMTEVSVEAEETTELVTIIACTIGVLVAVIVGLLICFCIVRCRISRKEKPTEKNDAIVLNNNISMSGNAVNTQEEYSTVNKTDKSIKRRDLSKENEAFDPDYNNPPLVPEKSKESRIFSDSGEQDENLSPDAGGPEIHAQSNTASPYNEALPAGFDSMPQTEVNEQNPYEEALAASYEYSQKPSASDSSRNDQTNLPVITKTDDDTFTLVVQNQDYAAPYLKTVGSDICDTTKNNVFPANPYSYADVKGVKTTTPVQPTNTGPYSYADNRGRFIKGITEHIVGDGYDIATEVKKKPNNKPPSDGGYQYVDANMPTTSSATKSFGGAKPKIKPVLKNKGKPIPAQHGGYEHIDTGVPDFTTSDHIHGTEYEDIANSQAITTPQPSPNRKSTASYQEITFVDPRLNPAKPKANVKKYAKDGAELFDNDVYSHQ